MHSQVKTWTKSVDIFNKDFVFVPINEKYVPRIANCALFVVSFNIVRTVVVFLSDVAQIAYYTMMIFHSRSRLFCSLVPVHIGISL